MKNLFFVQLAVATSGLALAWPAAAQVSGDTAQAEAANANEGLSDIVVTARRRAEPMQQTPIAVSAINPARMSEARVTNIQDLQSLAPSLSLPRDAINPNRVIPFIRGFGNKGADPSQEPAVAITVDGIYLGAQIGTFLNLFDVEAVEVLRGPQGTLLGKNAPAGGISIRTRRPSGDFKGMAQVDYGRFDDIQLRGYVDVPIARDKLSTTFSFFRRQSDGYVHNIVTREDVGALKTQSMRLAFLATPSDTVTWYITGSYDWDKGEDPSSRNISDFTPLRIPTANYPVVAPPVTVMCTSALSRALCTNGTLPNNRPYTTMASKLPDRNNRNYSATSDLAVDAGAIGIASVTGYRKFYERGSSDIDGTQLPVFDASFRGNYTQFSQEVRVSGGEGLNAGGRLNWLVGAYYYFFEYDRRVTAVTLGTPNASDQHQATNSYALFAHADYDILENLEISVGARQTWDRKRHDSRSPSFYAGRDQEVNESKSWQNFSMDAGLSYRITSDNMVFFRYAEGYRGGGFNGQPATAALATSFEPETVKSYEIGTKNDFFNHRLRLNLTVYQADYKDLQRVISDNVNFAPFFIRVPRNVASARTRGFEFEAQARPMQGLTLRSGIGYVDAKYTDYFANLTGVAANGASDNSNLAFPYISKWTATAGGTYEAELGEIGKLAFALDYAYRSTYNTTDQQYAFATQRGFGLLSGSITWTEARDRFSVSVYGANLTNKRYYEGADAVGGLFNWVNEGAPRTWGVSAQFKF